MPSRNFLGHTFAIAPSASSETDSEHISLKGNYTVANCPTVGPVSAVQSHFRRGFLVSLWPRQRATPIFLASTGTHRSTRTLTKAHTVPVCNARQPCHPNVHRRLSLTITITTKPFVFFFLGIYQRSVFPVSPLVLALKIPPHSTGISHDLVPV
jgi:hypothetical protein